VKHIRDKNVTFSIYRYRIRGRQSDAIDGDVKRGLSASKVNSLRVSVRRHAHQAGHHQPQGPRPSGQRRFRGMAMQRQRSGSWHPMQSLRNQLKSAVKSRKMSEP
jgi:hypothetical protein